MEDETAEDLKRLIEGFSSDVIAYNALQVSVIVNGLVVHEDIYQLIAANHC